ncbi:MAG TPA: CmcI family methyltransferase [Xanthobacteraceae bacterium]|nr:CmcI family methyltransferase [Xanthobacteraceae bacterium]
MQAVGLTDGRASSGCEAGQEQLGRKANVLPCAGRDGTLPRKARGYLMPVVIGSESIDRDQPPLSREDMDVIDRFHDLYYRRWMSGGADTKWLTWMGFKVVKCPLDLWIYQELLVRTRPDLVIETGTYAGGSALFLASVMDLIGNGRVISIDVEPQAGRPQHPRLSYWTGSSVDEAILAAARKAARGGRTTVVLDSDHSATHVFQEMMSYRDFVQVGDYLIVEDTNVNGHPTLPEFGPGPMEAVEKFLAQTDEFASDRRCERFLLTLNPKGYLKRVLPAR